MTRILMLTCQYMPDVFGGAEKQCQRIASEMRAQGHPVTVLTSTQTYSLRGWRHENGVDIYRLYTCIAPDLLGRWLMFSAMWWLMVMRWGWHRRRCFDLIHCHQGKFGAFVAVTLGRLLRCPVIIKIGNSEDSMDLRCLQRKAFVGPRMVRHVLEQRPTFIAISEVIARNLRDFGCQDIVTIPNGIPTSVHADGPSPINTQSVDAGHPCGPHFFYHGRVEPIKRLDVLIQAFGSLVEKFPSVRLHIIGCGSSLREIDRLIEALNLREKVHLYGKMPDPLRLIHQFDIYVNASLAEGFSNSLLEALLLNKVLVSTPVSGASDAIVPSRNGILSHDFSTAALCAAMEQSLALATQTQHCDVSRVCQGLIQERFAIHQVAAKYNALYGRLVSKEAA